MRRLCSTAVGSSINVVGYVLCLNGVTTSAPSSAIIFIIGTLQSRSKPAVHAHTYIHTYSMSRAQLHSSFDVVGPLGKRLFSNTYISTQFGEQAEAPWGKKTQAVQRSCQNCLVRPHSTDMLQELGSTEGQMLYVAISTLVEM